MPEFHIDYDKLMTEALAWAPKLIGALLVLMIGFWIVGNITSLLKKTMKRSNVDETLRPFLISLANVLLKITVVIAAAGMVDIKTTSFIAMLGAAGLAIGLALQGSLQNFAAGAMLLFFKPYKVGDLVELQGYIGHVLEIQIFNTILMTNDNKKVIIPNASVTSGPMTNISGQGKIRIDLTFGVAYDASIDKVREVVQAAADRNELILKNPGIDIFVSGHGASSVDFAIRPWCHPDNYWDVYFYMHEELKKSFDKAGIGIPYNTMDVNIISNK